MKISNSVYCKITQISQLIYDFQILSLPLRVLFTLLFESFFPTTLYTCSSLSGRFSSHSPINIIAVASCNYLFRPPRILDCVHKMAPPPGPTSSLYLCQQCYGLMQKSTMKREITTMSKLSSLSSRI